MTAVYLVRVQQLYCFMVSNLMVLNVYCPYLAETSATIFMESLLLIHFIYKIIKTKSNSLSEGFPLSNLLIILWFYISIFTYFYHQAVIARLFVQKSLNFLSSFRIINVRCQRNNFRILLIYFWLSGLLRNKHCVFDMSS